MKDVARLLNELRTSALIINYALFEATAQMRYTEPVATRPEGLLGRRAPSTTKRATPR